MTILRRARRISRARFAAANAGVLVVTAATIFALCVTSPAIAKPIAQTERTPTVTSTPNSTHAESTTEPTAKPTPSAPQLFLNIISPMSITVVVNKHRPLVPSDWVPPDIVVPQAIANPSGQGLRAVAADALDAMNVEAQASGITLQVNSGYRSYETQDVLYNSYIERDGLEKADTYSARPGHSEHQTGLAVDVDDGAGCGISSCFADTAAGQWIAANSYRYGFIVRYPPDGTPITGYMYEPWHLRYVGPQVATMMHDQGIPTMEQFFHLEAAPDYGA